MQDPVLKLILLEQIVPNLLVRVRLHGALAQRMRMVVYEKSHLVRGDVLRLRDVVPEQVILTVSKLVGCVLADADLVQIGQPPLRVKGEHLLSDPADDRALLPLAAAAESNERDEPVLRRRERDWIGLHVRPHRDVGGAEAVLGDVTLPPLVPAHTAEVPRDVVRWSLV